MSLKNYIDLKKKIKTFYKKKKKKKKLIAYPSSQVKWLLKLVN